MGFLFFSFSCVLCVCNFYLFKHSMKLFLLEVWSSISSSIFLNGAPCSCFSKKSSHMFLVGQHATLTSPSWSCQLQKITMLRWHIWFMLDNFPFSDSSIVLLLSCYIFAIGTNIPCSARKWSTHRIWPIGSSIPTSSASSEIFIISSCLHDEVYVSPFTIVTYTPAWLFMLGCTTYEL